MQLSKPLRARAALPAKVTSEVTRIVESEHLGDLANRRVVAREEQACPLAATP